MKLFISGLLANPKGINPPNISYPNDLGYQNIPTGILATNAIGNFQYNPNVLTIGSKTYISVFDITTSNPYILVYDHISEKVSDLIVTGIEFPHYDIHNAPAIIGTNDGRIALCVNIRGGGLPKEKRVYVSGPNYDIKSWSLTQSATSDEEYPHMQPASDGNIYSVERDYNTNAYEMIVKQSVDDGRTWNKTYLVYRSPELVDLRPYNLQVWIDENDVLKAFVNIQEMDIPEHIYLLYMESVDFGKTWTNKEGTYSQDISSTPLNTTTMLNYVAYEAPAGSFITARGGGEIDGNPWAIGRLSAYTNMGVMYWDGLAWQSSLIDAPGYTTDDASQGSYLYKKNGTYHLMIQCVIGGYDQLCEFTAPDLVSQWTLLKQHTSRLSNHSTIKVNYNDEYGTLFVSSTGDGDLYIDKIEV